MKTILAALILAAMLYLIGALAIDAAKHQEQQTIKDAANYYKQCPHCLNTLKGLNQ